MPQPTDSVLAFPRVVAVAGMLAAVSLVLMSSARHRIVHSYRMEPSASARPATKVTPVSCEKLADVPGKAITTATVFFPPNAYTPAHRHPGSVTAFVIEGSVKSQIAGGPAITYHKGETWFEPRGALHVFAENPSLTVPAELLTVMIANENCGPFVIPEQ